MCQVMIYTLEKCPAVNKPDKVLADYRGRNTGYEKQKQKIVIADINYVPAFFKTCTCLLFTNSCEVKLLFPFSKLSILRHRGVKPLAQDHTDPKRWNINLSSLAAEPVCELSGFCCVSTKVNAKLNRYINTKEIST